MTSKGILYIAVGNKFVEEAKVSAETVKEQMPHVPITLITDGDKRPSQFDTVIHIDEPREDFGDQVYNLEKSPYERTIFLDSDIYLTDEINDLFHTLDEFDIAAAHNQRKHSSNQIDMDAINALPECFPEYNSGVVAYKLNTRVKKFLSEWQDAYAEVVSRGQVHNQAAFRLALYQSDLRIATLPSVYNCVFRRPGCVNGSIKVFHGRLIETQSRGAGMNVDVEQAITELNSKSELRTYYRVGNRVRLAKPNLLMRAAYSVWDQGIIPSLKSLVDRIDKINISKN